jgi:asparagine synthetase B (glutamine-hydrolysing)
MCGLAGIFHPNGPGAIDAALLARMTTALAHRGPDGDGFLSRAAGRTPPQGVGTRFI